MAKNEGEIRKDKTFASNCERHWTTRRMHVSGSPYRLTESHVPLKVVSETDKQHLACNLRFCAASELPQATFAFDPGMRELRYLCALAINLFCASSIHPIIKLSNGNLIVGDRDLAPSLFQCALPATIPP